MFDDGLEAALGDRRALADLSAAVQLDHRMAGCRKLVLAAVWADAHSSVDHPDGGLLVEQLVALGPVGCPLVAETAAAGLVLPFQTSVQGVRGWIGDALNLRHRLPVLWARVVAGEVHHWKAREIAQQTAQLNPVTAGLVDAQITRWVEQLPWASLLRAVEAVILQVDEGAYQERERLAAAKREVRATPSEHGLRTLIARGEAGEVAMMLALYGRVAEALADEGDEDPLPVRMSKAIGVIANPARLVDLLARHHGDPDPHRAPWENVAAHQDDPTDPWAEDLPPAGWQTARHGNHHQPSFDDDDCWDSQLRRYLVQTDANITVQPVIDPAETASADAYEIPLRLRRAMTIRQPRSVFPHSPATGRMDLDHTRPWQSDGPPGQTGLGNLGPLTRSEHRAKTVGRWRSRQPEPGTYLWRSPEGWIAITTNQGTLTLGHTDWATQLWPSCVPTETA